MHPYLNPVGFRFQQNRLLYRQLDMPTGGNENTPTATQKSKNDPEADLADWLIHHTKKAFKAAERGIRESATQAKGAIKEATNAADSMVARKMKKQFENHLNQAENRMDFAKNTLALLDAPDFGTEVLKEIFLLTGFPIPSNLSDKQMVLFCQNWLNEFAGQNVTCNGKLGPETTEALGAAANAYLQSTQPEEELILEESDLPTIPEYRRPVYQKIAKRYNDYVLTEEDFTALADLKMELSQRKGGNFENPRYLVDYFVSQNPGKFSPNHVNEASQYYLERKMEISEEGRLSPETCDAITYFYSDVSWFDSSILESKRGQKPYKNATLIREILYDKTSTVEEVVFGVRFGDKHGLLPADYVYAHDHNIHLEAIVAGVEEEKNS